MAHRAAAETASLRAEVQRLQLEAREATEQLANSTARSTARESLLASREAELAARDSELAALRGPANGSIAASLPLGELERMEQTMTALQASLHERLTTVRRTIQDKRDAERQCVICMDARAHIAFDCGHCCTCANCSGQVTDCPVCRRRVSTRIPLFL